MRASTRGPGFQRAVIDAEARSSRSATPDFPTRTSLYDRTPGESRAPAVSLGNNGRDDLTTGQRIFHGKFGYGTIAAIEGNKLEIDFEHAGRKRVLDSFVSLG